MNMKKIKLWKWQCLLMLALAFAMLLMPAAALADEESATTQQPLLQWSDDLSKAKYFLNNYAYFDLDAQVLQAADVPSMIKALQKTDPWAYYFTAEEFKLFVTEIEGDFVGIGVYITTEDGSLFVQGVIANSPAEKAGLKYGDIIVGVDKLSAPQATADELAEALGGEENTLVTIKYKRDGKVIEEVMSRKSIMIPSMEYWLMDDIVGYIQIEQFTSHTGEELAAAVQSLKKQ
ncbi:MAG: PDZ domain-containing protein, partial [Clostridiales bacterium]|nr:PDZ domain-containing protein [Clostridiales bacterium]